MKKLALTIFSIMLLHSCKTENKTSDTFNEQKERVNEAQGMDGHTSINSLDWQGTYSGTLPCADCDGIFTEVTLNSDKTYVLHSTKMNGDLKVKSSIKGLYQWDETGSQISMERDGTTTIYKVGEHKLVLVAKNGTPMAASKTENYTLSKEEKKAAQ